MFGFPLRQGHVRLGVPNLYRDQPGPMSDEQDADAVVLANLVTETVLFLQAEAPPGQLAIELQQGVDLQLAVHQASGMVSAQLGITVDQALARLRAHAFGNERPLHDIAQDVIARTLVFDEPHGELDPTA